MIILVLIAGKRFVGKDYLATKLANFLADLKYFVEIKSLADKVKEEYALSILKDHKLYPRLRNDRDFKEEHRKGIITLAQNEKDKYGDEIWICRLLESIHTNGIYIVPDCRFKSEVNYVLSNKISNIVPLIIRIEANDDIRMQRGWKPDSFVDTDYSETDLDNWDKFDIVVDGNTNLSDEKLNLINSKIISLCREHALRPIS